MIDAKRLRLPEMIQGSVWLVGAGPGDPGLLSVLALHALGQADTVVYDALVDPRILTLARPSAALEDAGKRGGRPSPRQPDISARLVALARDGKRVLRLKGGDPCVFGRGGEEALALAAAGIPFRIVPGITAAIGGLAYAGIPLTHRDINSAVTLITGHNSGGAVPGEDDTAPDWAAIAKGSPVIVLYMALTHLGDIAAPADRGRAGRPSEAGGDRQQGDDGGAAGGHHLARCRRFRRRASREPGDHRHRRGRAAARDARLVRGVSAGGLILAAAKSGSGKTLITAGLLRHLQSRGIKIVSAKTGPDYIDPTFHALASGASALNLDPWAMRPATLAGLVGELEASADIVLCEGVMGLFDGAGPDGEAGSTAALARITGWPVVLIVDAAGQGASIAALVAGFARHDPQVPLAGIILNRVASARHRALLTDAIARHLPGLPVLGAMMQDKTLAIGARHLGLVPAEENSDVIETLIGDAAALIAADFDIGRLIALARPATCVTALGASGLSPPGQRIAVARDAAFLFAYRAVLAGWRRRGAEISFFSPLADETPAPDCDAIYLPGGYPELHAGELAAAGVFLGGLREAAAANKPIHGECGGYMVLGDNLIDADGTTHRMAGLLPLVTSFAAPRRQLGYRVATLLGSSPLGAAGARFRGHEFHYASIVEEGAAEPLFAIADASGGDLGHAGLRRGSVAGSFIHLIDREAD